MKIDTSSTAANIAKVIDVLADTPKRLKTLGKSLPQTKRNHPLGSGERSFVETLAHLTNSEARTSEAIYLALLMDVPELADVHSEREWGRLLQYELLDFDDLLDYFNLRRRVMMRVLSGLTEAQWNRSVREKGKKRNESVYWKARSLALHEAEHIAGLEDKISKIA